MVLGLCRPLAPQRCGQHGPSHVSSRTPCFMARLIAFDEDDDDHGDEARRVTTSRGDDGSLLLQDSTAPLVVLHDEARVALRLGPVGAHAITVSRKTFEEKQAESTTHSHPSGQDLALALYTRAWVLIPFYHGCMVVCVCVCARARTRVRACVRACVRVCVRVCVCLRVYRKLGLFRRLGSTGMQVWPCPPCGTEATQIMVGAGGQPEAAAVASESALFLGAASDDGG